MISILMPVYNARDSLPHALRSVRWQTFRDWQLVAADDGSVDGSRAVLREWARSDPRIRVLELPHRGLVETLNAGLAACEGRFVFRMDADDICHPRRLERQLAFLQPGHVVSCRIRMFPAAALRCGFRRYENWVNSLVLHEQIARDVFVESPLVHPTIGLEKELLEEVGGYRECGWPEDYDLWLRLWERGVLFTKAPEVLFYWRDHPARLTRTHERYEMAALRRLKAHFLLRTYLRDSRPFAVWGAGRNGKRLARELARQGGRLAAFVDLHPRRIGERIDGIPVHHPDGFPDAPGTFHLAAVGREGGREDVREQLLSRGLVELRDFVCVA
ncbi:MAG: glycosyltransferase [Armatimonadetes bacterium]|nr:glycosyltransferase [Armatimonadota bacterium]